MAPLDRPNRKRLAFLTDELHGERRQEENFLVSSATGSCANPLVPGPTTKVFQRPRLSKKQVSFATCVDTMEIPHYVDLTAAEIEAAWWSPNDYAMIKKTARTSTQLLMQGHKFEDDSNDFCKRGLESRTSAGAEKRSRTKQRLIKAVLRAQYFQRLESLNDPAYIAEVCAQHTESSVVEAQTLALAWMEEQ